MHPVRVDNRHFPMQLVQRSTLRVAPPDVGSGSKEGRAREGRLHMHVH